MKITIGKFSATTRTVPVTFMHNGVRHKRDVNACFNTEGRYDAEATAARVNEVADGVAQKIEMGLFSA